MNSPEPLYMPSDAARLLGITIGTLRLWERDCKIKATRTVGGHRRISQSEIDRVLTAKEGAK